MLWTGLLLTLALSLDGFIVGMHYGIRRIKIPFGSLVIIGACTALGMGASMAFGEGFSGLISVEGAHVLGGGVLIALGLWQLLQAWLEYVRRQNRTSRRALFRLRVRPLGVVVQVLADPTQVDHDDSGVIDVKEALVLGVALGLDTLAAGFAAAMLGFALPLAAGVAGGLLLLVWVGLRYGHRFGPAALGGRGMFIPGLVLVIMGILQL